MVIGNFRTCNYFSQNIHQSGQFLLLKILGLNICYQVNQLRLYQQIRLLKIDISGTIKQSLFKKNLQNIDFDFYVRTLHCEEFIDPLGRPTVMASKDHCFRTCCPYVRPSPLFKSRKTKQQKTMFATGVTMGLAEWIIDDTCLVFSFIWKFKQVLFDFLLRSPHNISIKIFYC